MPKHGLRQDQGVLEWRRGVDVVHFVDDDAGYLRWLVNNPRGYVVNAQRTPKPGYPILHPCKKRWRAARLTSGTSPKNCARWGVAVASRLAIDIHGGIVHIRSRLSLSTSNSRAGDFGHHARSVLATVMVAVLATLAGCLAAPPSFASTTYSETAGGAANTWTDYLNAGGAQGPTIPAYTTVQVTCAVSGFRVADGNTWWYQIASSPWDNAYFVSADAFYNDGASSGSLAGTPYVDPAVPLCSSPPACAMRTQTMVTNARDRRAAAGCGAGIPPHPRLVNPV